MQTAGESPALRVPVETEGGRKDVASTLGPVTHGFLAGEKPLFASYHAPKGPPRSIAYVVCLPIHLDLIQCYRSMRRLAEELAGAGFHVMRIHYEGTQESIGSTDLDPNRVDGWLESVQRAVAAMKAIPGIEGVGLVGVRLGSTLALAAATKVEVARVIMWEPTNGAFYGREMEILAASTPQRIGSTEGSASGGGVVAGGYFLSQGTLADLAKLDPDKMQVLGKPDVMLVYRSDRKAPPRLQKHLEGLGCNVTLTQPAGHKEMMVMPQRSAVPSAILDAVRDWAIEHSRAAPEVPERADLKLEGEAIVDGLRWRAIRFGSANHLFGVLTEPVSGPKSKLPAIFLLTGGVTPRTAGNQSYVTLARRLAARGHAVLRMDVSFIGESGTPDGLPGKDTDPYPPSILDDAHAGLERIAKAVSPGTKIWLLGLCSGAYAAFHTILRDRSNDRVRGVFLLNPERFDLISASNPVSTTPADEAAPAPQEEEEKRPMATAESLEQMSRYWQVMKDPKSWKKLLSGKADYRHLFNVLSSRVGSKLASVKEQVGVRLGRAPKGVAGDFDGMLGAGMKVQVVFSEGDPGQAAFHAELGARLDPLVQKGLSVKVFAGADHNFHEMSSRSELIDWVLSVVPDDF